MTKHYTLTEDQLIIIIGTATAYLGGAKKHDPESFRIAYSALMGIAAALDKQRPTDGKSWQDTIDTTLNELPPPPDGMEIDPSVQAAICQLLAIAVSLGGMDKDRELAQHSRNSANAVIEWAKTVDEEFGNTAAQTYAIAATIALMGQLEQMERKEG